MAGTSLDLHVQPGDPAHQVLTVFLHGGEYSVPELAGLTGLAPVETARWAATLTNLRLLDRGHGQSYRPGAALRINAGLSPGATGAAPGGRDRTGVLDSLAAIAGGQARIGVLHDEYVSYLRTAIATGPGQREPSGFGSAGSLPADHSELQQSALGQVLLAYTRDGVASGLVGRVPALAGPATAERDELDLSLSVVRLSGVAMTRGPSTLDIAVPVFGPDGQVEIALEISTAGFSEADAAVLEQLRRIAQRLSG